MNSLSEDVLSSVIKGFLAFLATLVAVFLLLSDSLLFDKSFGTVNGGIPAIFILILFLTLFLFVFRAISNHLSKPAVLRVMFALAFLGTVLVPFLFLLDTFWILAVPFIGLGLAMLVFSWCLYLCNFSHKLLVSYLAIAFALGACIATIIMFLDLPDSVLIIVFCALMLLTWLFLLFEQRGKNLELLQITAEESQKRAVTRGIDRWTYSVIGLNLGFAISLVHLLSSLGSSTTPLLDPELEPYSLLIYALPAVLTGIVLLILRSKYEFVFEKYSKDFLAFCVALCLLPISFVPPGGVIVCLMLLLFVVFVQLVIVINASIEFIRFDQLSPAWYMAEGAFVVGGAAVGTLLAWLGHAESSLVMSVPFWCTIVVLVNIFAQFFINKGSYPQAESVMFAEKSPVAEKGLAGTGDINDYPSDNGSGAPRKGAWKLRVERVSKLYDLSPRQSEILELLAKGRDAKYIEDHFCISKSTTKSHIYNIYCKLDIHSRQELIDIVETIDDFSTSQESAH